MFSHGALEIRRLGPELEHALADFFCILEANGDGRHFHPHPLTRAEAVRLCARATHDLYYVAVDDGEILAYGILRGWDEGFSIPSLGIALHPKVRRSGISRVFMLFLHAAAKRRGARRVRLKVHKDNVAAERLYRQLGYQFEAETAMELVGILNL